MQPPPVSPRMGSTVVCACLRPFSTETHAAWVPCEVMTIACWPMSILHHRGVAAVARQPLSQRCERVNPSCGRCLPLFSALCWTLLAPQRARYIMCQRVHCGYARAAHAVNEVMSPAPETQDATENQPPVANLSVRPGSTPASLLLGLPTGGGGIRLEPPPLLSLQDPDPPRPPAPHAPRVYFRPRSVDTAIGQPPTAVNWQPM